MTSPEKPPAQGADVIEPFGRRGFRSIGSLGGSGAPLTLAFCRRQRLPRLLSKPLQWRAQDQGVGPSRSNAGLRRKSLEASALNAARHAHAQHCRPPEVRRPADGSGGLFACGDIGDPPLTNIGVAL